MINELKSKIREIPDWPQPGVNFKDITTLLLDKASFRLVVDQIAAHLAGKQTDKIVGVDARGFLIAAPVAYKLGLGLAIVRKKGKLPFSTIEQEYALEYGNATIQMHQDAILPKEKVALVDDLLATGGTALAACGLIEKLGGKIVSCCFVVELPFLDGARKIKERGYDLKSLVSYDQE